MSIETERLPRYRREALTRGCVLGRDNEGKEQVKATPESFDNDMLKSGYKVTVTATGVHVAVATGSTAATN